MREFLKYGLLPFALLAVTWFLLGIAASGMVNGTVGAVVWLVGTVMSIWASVFVYVRMTRNKDVPYYQSNR